MGTGDAVTRVHAGTWGQQPRGPSFCVPGVTRSPELFRRTTTVARLIGENRWAEGERALSGGARSVPRPVLRGEQQDETSTATTSPVVAVAASGDLLRRPREYPLPGSVDLVQFDIEGFQA